MKILYVYAHPYDQSFNASMYEFGINELQRLGHEVVDSNLYAMHFKAAADLADFTNLTIPDKTPFGALQMEASLNNQLAVDILQEQHKVIQCQLLILQFPLWWFGVPAIMKGWFDRIFTAGFAYGVNKWFDTAPLYGRKAMLAFSTQAPETSYTERGLNGDMRHILHPIHHALRFVGFEILEPFIAYGVTGAADDHRKQLLTDYQTHLQKLAELPILSFNTIKDFDDDLVLKSDVDNKLG